MKTTLLLSTLLALQCNATTIPTNLDQNQECEFTELNGVNIAGQSLTLLFELTKPLVLPEGQCTWLLVLQTNSPTYVDYMTGSATLNSSPFELGSYIGDNGEIGVGFYTTERFDVTSIGFNVNLPLSDYQITSGKLKLVVYQTPDSGTTLMLLLLTCVGLFAVNKKENNSEKTTNNNRLLNSGLYTSSNTNN